MSVRTTPMSLLLLLISFLFSIPIHGQFHFEGLSFKGQGDALMKSLSSVDISPDGNYVYASSYDQNAINVFSRNTITGNLTFVEAATNGISKVEGLGGAFAIVVSPDGGHVYVAGSTDNSVTAFTRDVNTGKLAIVASYRNGIGGISGLSGAYHMDFSSDGNYLYTIGTDSSTMVVFERNVSSGKLEMIEKFKNGENGVTNMSFPAGVLVSPDGKSVYVSGYGDNAVAIFSRNNTDGTLNYQGAISNNDISDLTGPSVMGISPNSQQLYVSAASSNSLIVLDRNTNDGTLTNPVVLKDGVNGVDGLSGVISVITNSTGDYVYALGSNEDAIAIFQNNNGVLSYVDRVKDGVNSVNNFVYPVYFVMSPDDQHVYAASSSSEAVVSFDINSIGTHMTYNSNITADPNAVDGLDGAKAVAVSPDGNNVYAVGYNDDAIVVFTRNEKNGLMEYMEFHKNRSNGVTGMNGATDVVVSGDGKHVYVASQNDHSLVVFSRNTSTGAITYRNSYKDRANQNGNIIDGLTGANAIAQSPDGLHIYVTGYFENAISVFSRDANTDELTYVEVLKDGDSSGGGNIDGLSRVRGIAISDDGKHVYACGSIDNAISIFSRDASTGKLTYVNRVKNGFNNVSGILGVYDVIVSPNGQFVFAAGPNSDAVVTFARNSTTGELSYSGKVENGIDNVGGLDKVKQLTINPDGTRLYSSSDGENAISVFDINSGSGLLSFVTMAVDNQDGIGGLNGAFGMAVSPSGMFIYGSSDESNAVTVFSCTYLQEQTTTICEGNSITVGSNTYNTTGVYIDTTVNGSCRTVMTTDLTVPEKNYSLSAEICSGGVYNFGGTLYNTSGTYEKTFQSIESGCDSVVTLNLSVVNIYSTTTVDAEICEGESYTLGNSSFTTSGTYTETLTSQFGCDSTVMVNLEVYSNDPTVMNEFICSGEFFEFNGRNYISSGTYTMLSPTPNQCNDMVTLNLTVADGDETINTSICQGDAYEIDGISYTNAGSFNQTVTTANGCSIDITLNLSVNTPDESDLSETICEGDNYMFNGTSYTESGTYTATFSNRNGCDSTVTLTLDIQPTRFESSETICEGESITIGTSIFSTTGTHEVTLQSNNGCGDSTVVVNLTVTETQNTSADIEICEGESITINGQPVFVSGTYTENLFTVDGCDSIHTIMLTVLPASFTTMEAEICSGSTYTFYGQDLSTTGIYTESYSLPNGCDSTIELNLTVLEDIEASDFIINDSGLGTGLINITRTTGGRSPYNYYWSNGETGTRITGLDAGNYTLSIIDDAGCKAIFEYEVTDLTVTSNQNFEELDLEVDVLSNPVLTNNVIRLMTTSEEAVKLSLQLYSINGQVLQTESLQILNGKQVHEINAPGAAGLYLLHLKDQRGRGKTLKISVQ